MTIEGLAKDGKLHPIQEGFWEKHGLQCGFCTPGMIMSAYQILERNPKPTRGRRSATSSRAISAAAPATTTSSRPSSTRPRRWPREVGRRAMAHGEAASARASSGARTRGSSPGKGNYIDDLKLPGHDLRGLRAKPARPRPDPRRSTLAKAKAHPGRGGGLHRQGHDRASTRCRAAGSCPEHEDPGVPGPARLAHPLTRRASYVGDPVAVVIAESQDAARDARRAGGGRLGACCPSVTDTEKAAAAGRAPDPRRRARQRGLQVGDRRRGRDRRRVQDGAASWSRSASSTSAWSPTPWSRGRAWRATRTPPAS